MDTPLIFPETNIRDMLVRWPATRTVLEMKGLLGCGGQEGPDERLDFFAMIHRIGKEELLEELNRVASGKAPLDASTSQPLPTAGEAASTLYLRFVLGAMATGILAGALSGLIFLYRLRLGMGAVSDLQKEAHGHLQLFGFVFLLLMGVAYHALPRFLGTTLRPLWAARAGFASMLVASLGWMIMLVSDEEHLSHLSKVIASGGLLLAASVFVLVIFSTLRAASSGRESYQSFLRLGTVGWLGAAALDVLVSILHHTSAATSCGPLNEAVYATAFFLAILPWTFGMTLRATAMFMGLDESRPPLIRGSLWLLAAGGLAIPGAQVLSEFLHRPMLPLEIAGQLLLSLAVIFFLAGSRVFEKARFPVERGSFPFALQVRVSHAFLGLVAVLSWVWISLSLRGGAPERGFGQDGMRHALAAGYLLLLMTAMMGRVLPIFGGKALRHSSIFTLGSLLIALGALMRQTEVVFLFAPSTVLLKLSAHSGALLFAGLLLSFASILATLLLPAAQAAARKAQPGALPDTSWLVSDILNWHPGALDVLADAGFAPLRNPVLRATLAKTVSLKQAAAMHHLDAGRLLEKILALQDPTPPKSDPVREALESVMDPEVGENIVDLGLIYDIREREGDVTVLMTFTTPQCPMSGGMKAEVLSALSAAPGVKNAQVEVTYDPPWSPEKMSPRLREKFRIGNSSGAGNPQKVGN